MWRYFRKDTPSQPLDWDKYAPIEKLYLEAEEKRLLYVAATRARNLLVVSVYPDKTEASPWHPFSGHFAGVPELEEVQAGTPQTAGDAGAEITAQDLFEDRAVRQYGQIFSALNELVEDLRGLN